MYRLGVSHIDNAGARDTDADLRNSFLNPATPIVRNPSGCDQIGSTIYDPVYYSSLFEEHRDGVCSGHLNTLISKLAFLSHKVHKICALPLGLS